MSFKWTPEEDEVLKVEWAAGTVQSDIAEKLTGRSASGISGRARILGLPKRAQGRHQQKVRTWTPDETEALLALYADGVGLSEISRTLDRTITACDWRLMVLGAKRMSASKIKVEPKSTMTKRRCLRCSHSFASEGKHNRVCNRCKSGSTWRGGGDYEVRI